MAIRVGYVVAFLFGIAIGAGLGWFAAPRHAALRPIDAHGGSASRPTAPLVASSAPFSSWVTADAKHPYSVDVPEPRMMAASPGDVRLEVRSAIGSLLEGTSLQEGHGGMSDEEIFLAAWEKFAADDRRLQSTSDPQPLHGHVQPLRGLAVPAVFQEPFPLPEKSSEK